MRVQRLNTYVACDDLNFIWDERDVLQFQNMWDEGVSIFEIAQTFQRDVDEIVLLAIDRGRKGYIQKRDGGVYGKG